MSDSQFAFYQSEREFLLRQIDSDIQETRRIERLVILAAAAVYTWLATESSDQTGQFAWAWWIPFGITVLGIVRSFAILQRISVMANYIKHIEEKYATIDGLPGWRNYFHRQGRGKVTRAVSVSWVILLITTTIVPVLLHYG